jgi:hypothetical protein
MLLGDPLFANEATTIIDPAAHLVGVEQPRGRHAHFSAGGIL